MAADSRTQTALDALVLDADLRQSLVCVRSLGRLGIRVGALACRDGAPAFRSRWCASSRVVPDFTRDPDAFVDAVLEEVARTRARVVVSSHDGAIEALRARRDEVERHATLALAPEPALAVAASKARTLELAVELGIPIPRSLDVEDVGDVPAAVAELGFPVVVKPTDPWVWRGTQGSRLICAVAVNQAEAARAVAALRGAGSSVILQEWLPGAREAVSLFHAEGRVWARFAQVATRTHPPLGGSSVARDSIPMPPDALAAAEALVRAAGLDGYSEIEFRRDARGRAALMEINPRLSASVEVAVRAGVDFPALIHAWAAGRPLTEVPGYRTGVRMRWLGGDLRWLRDTLGNQGRPDVVPRFRAVATFVGDCFRPASYDYLAASDVRPLFTAATGFVGEALARLRRPSPLPITPSPSEVRR